MAGAPMAPDAPSAAPVTPPSSPSVIPSDSPAATLPGVPGSRLVGIAEASAALGISQSVIRRRLKDGRLQGERQHTPQGYVWLVYVPEAPQATEETDAAADTAANPSVSPPAVEGAVLAELAAAREAVTRLEAHNADLRSQVETLTGELTARRREVTELHTLVGMVSRALPAPASPVTPPDNPSTDPATPTADPRADPADSPASPDPAADPADSPAANRAWWRRAWDWFNGSQLPA
jgi:hypothetical protein